MAPSGPQHLSYSIFQNDETSEEISLAFQGFLDDTAPSLETLSMELGGRHGM